MGLPYYSITATTLKRRLSVFSHAEAMRGALLPLLVMVVATALVCAVEDAPPRKAVPVVAEPEPQDSAILVEENKQLKRQNKRLNAKLQKLPHVPEIAMMQANAGGRRRRHVVVPHVGYSRRRYYSRYGTHAVYVESGGGIVGSIIGGIFFLCICGIVLCIV